MTYFQWSVLAFLVCFATWLVVFLLRKIANWVWCRTAPYPASSNWFYYNVLPNLSRPFYWIFMVADVNLLATLLYEIAKH